MHLYRSLFKNYKQHISISILYLFKPRIVKNYLFHFQIKIWSAKAFSTQSFFLLLFHHFVVAEEIYDRKRVVNTIYNSFSHNSLELGSTSNSQTHNIVLNNYEIMVKLIGKALVSRFLELK